ncbi:MAG: hypothetical protein ABSH47_23230 [Bryobacteraceae bacterium]|jgi:hypothetical protein
MMNRKAFLVQLTGYGAATAGVASLAALAPCCAAAATLPAAAEGTPIDKRMAFAQTWAKRMMDNVDDELDEPTRARLMHANGRSCFRGSGQKPFPGGVDAFIEQVRKWSGTGPSPIRREGDIVYFDYVQNPAGLKVADGWCLCPLVEKGPEGLSGTFCECSVGYVTEMFSGVAGKPVRVELLESLKRGGKACRFRIHLT